jgi:hypothetical protein
MADNQSNNLSRLFQTAGSSKPQQGTGYTNLNRLFEANKQNQLGQKVAGDLGTQIGGVQTQLQQQQKQFAEESEKNKMGGQKDVEQRDAVLGRFNSPSGAGSDVTEEETSTFGRFIGGQYGGPQTLKDTSDLRQTAQQLQGQVSNFSPAGTQELLRRSVGGNRYTQGQSRLDSLLMDRSKLTPVSRQAQGLGQEINRAELAASGTAELNKNLAQSFGDETKTKLNTGLTTIDTSVSGQLAAAQKAEEDRIAAVREIEAVNRTGGSSIDKLSKMEALLRGKTDEANINKVFGTVGATQQRTNVQNALNDLYGAYAAQRSAQGVNPGALLQTYDARNNTNFLNQNIVGTIEGSYGFAPTEAAKYRNVGENSILAEKLKAGIMGNTTYLPYNGQRYQTGSNIDSKIGNLPASLVQSLLQKSLADENSAKNVTAQGVASESQRANYEALNKLLQRQATDNKYNKDADKYSAGNILFDPTQVY